MEPYIRLGVEERGGREIESDTVEIFGKSINMVVWDNWYPWYLSAMRHGLNTCSSLNSPGTKSHVQSCVSWQLALLGTYSCGVLILPQSVKLNFTDKCLFGLETKALTTTTTTTTETANV